MLIGEYTHVIDEKKRMSLPAKFRKLLGSKVVVTYGLENCLFLYPVKEWEKITEKLSTLSTGQADARAFNRLMLAGAVLLEVDSIGRVLIPDFHREYADLKTKAVVTGVHNRVEIWNDKRWNDYKKKITERADILAEKLGEIGAF